jgi:hypothetical protein
MTRSRPDGWVKSRRLKAVKFERRRICLVVLSKGRAGRGVTAANFLKDSSRGPRFSRRTRASGDPAENRLIVRNGTVTSGGMFEHSGSQTLNHQLSTNPLSQLRVHRSLLTPAHRQQRDCRVLSLSCAAKTFQVTESFEHALTYSLFANSE